MLSVRARVAVLAVLALSAVLISYAVVSGDDDQSPGVMPSKSEELESTATDTTQLESTATDTTKFEAMRRAVKAGEIREEQNPCSYPAYLREIIELTDEQCAGELGQKLAEQYD